MNKIVLLGASISCFTYGLLHLLDGDWLGYSATITGIWLLLWTVFTKQLDWINFK